MERPRNACFEINSKEFKCCDSFNWTSWSREMREVGRVKTTQKHLLSFWSVHKRREVKRRHSLLLTAQDGGIRSDMVVSSTYWCTSRRAWRSLIKAMNYKGPSRESCSIPPFSDLQEETQRSNVFWRVDNGGIGLIETIVSNSLGR